jgi:hypothetical protein
MHKILKQLLIANCYLLFAICATAHAAAPQPYRYGGSNTRTTYPSSPYGNYNVNYNYQTNNYVNTKQKSGWYGAIRGAINLVSWESTYNSDWALVNNDFKNEKFSMRPIFGGSLAVGKTFWDGEVRGEVELGYTGRFSDKEPGFEFEWSAPYALVNAMHDFQSGIFIGGGIGLAMPTTTLDSDIFFDGDRKKTNMSPMGALMFGWSRQIDDYLILDLRYRFGGFMGTKQTRYMEDGLHNVYFVENKMGLITEHSISAGLRYEF